MSMNQAFYTGLTGLHSTQFGIDTVSHNIANVNTVGFKSSTAEFASIYEGSISTELRSGPEEKQTGVGSRVSASDIDFSTGVLQKTDRNTDMAIAGNGWFGIQNSSGTSYTRAGNFQFDAQRNLTQPDGSFLLGTLGNNISNGVLTEELSDVALAAESAQQPLTFPKSLTYPAKATSNVEFFANLGLENVPRTMGSTIIDAEGNKNILKLTFTQNETQPSLGSLWDVEAVLFSADETTQLDTQKATASFDAAGALVSNTFTPMNNNGSAFTIDLGEGFSGVTAHSNSFVTSRSQSDGVPEGDLVGYDVNADGVITAAFSNSKTSALGKVAIYHFSNNQGLEAIDGTHYRETSNSGKAHFWKDSEGNNTLGTTLITEHLEGSNVKFEVALTELIILQRSFDANSKSITTGDQLIQKALQMDA